MWTHMARIIGEVRPRFAFMENSPALITRGLGVVLSDLAALGYDTRWGVLGAADVGAPHRRERIWILAYAREIGWSGAVRDGDDGAKGNDGDSTEWREDRFATDVVPSVAGICAGWPNKPDSVGMVDGVADWTYRLAAIGNGQVPQCAAAAWRMLGGP